MVEPHHLHVYGQVNSAQAAKLHYSSFPPLSNRNEPGRSRLLANHPRTGLFLAISINNNYCRTEYRKDLPQAVTDSAFNHENNGSLKNNFAEQTPGPGWRGSEVISWRGLKQEKAAFFPA